MHSFVHSCEPCTLGGGVLQNVCAVPMAAVGHRCPLTA